MRPVARSDHLCYNRAKELVPYDDFALLAPSIKYMKVDEGTRQPAFKDVGDGQLTLHGIFGSDSGDDRRVTINERALEIRSWEKNEIVVRLPEATDPDGARDMGPGDPSGPSRSPCRRAVAVVEGEGKRGRGK